MNTQKITLNLIIGAVLMSLMIFTTQTSARENGKIAFVSNRDGNPEIYVMNADGSNQTRLTNSPFTDENPSFSPDGTKIAFHSHRNHPTGYLGEVYVMNDDGSNQRRLTTSIENEGDSSQPAWSPDGTRIAYVRYDSSDGNKINVINTNGTGQTTIFTTGFPVLDVAWSPNGSKIAFVLEDGYEAINIYVMNANGNNVAQLTQATIFEYNLAPAWSPDSAKIAFSRDYYDFGTGGEITTLNVMEANGK